MRRTPLVLSLLLASSAVFAQTDGVMIFKSEQPYVSPFDKTPSGRPTPAASLFSSTPPVEAEATPHGEAVNVEVREVEKQETQKRAQAFIAKPQAKQAVPVRKAESARKAEEPRVAVKKEAPKAVVVATPAESKPAPAKVEASVIPPKDAQNPKAELAPPPAALAVKENGLTSFGNEKAAPVASSVAAAATTAVITPEQVVVEAPVVLDETNTTQNDGFFPGWLLKAVLFFILGGLAMAGGWYWVKRQALYGDPAFHDPWFRPVKSR